MNVSHVIWSTRIGACLVWRDMLVFRSTFRSRLINGACWAASTVVVFQHFGMDGVVPAQFGFFMACGNIISWGNDVVMENMTVLAGDIQGERSIEYALTLPLPQWMVLVRFAISNALQGMAVAIFLVPLSKLLLWNSFSLAHFSIPRFLLIFLLANLYYGFFSLWVTTKVKSIGEIGNVWTRIIFPLWFLGAYMYSWQLFASQHPIIACISLVNPMLYCMEGTRAAIMGQEGFLPFWLCCVALIFFTVVVGVLGIRILKKRLDCL